MKKILYFLPFFIVVTAALLAPRLIKISQIDCASEAGVCSSYITEKIAKAKGKNIIDAKNYIGDVFTKDVEITNYSVKFKLPDRLEVFVIEKKAIVAIGKPDNPNYVLIDSEGRVLSIEKETSLPIILTGSDFTDKKDVPASLSFAANLLYDLNLVYEAKTARIIDGSLQVEIKNLPAQAGTIIFPLEGDRQVLIGALKVILSGLHREGQVNTIKVIDLRFKNPVLK